MPQGGPLLLRHDDLAVAPWRNGGGLTREVASGRFDGGRDGTVEDSAPFDWRISIADVSAAGPFSAFPGVDRVITLVEGQLMVLVVDGREERLQLHEPFAFVGEAATRCALPQGRTRDLNLMTRRGRCTGSVEVLDASGGPQWLACGRGQRDTQLAAVVAVVGLAGTTSVTLDGRTEPVRLGPLDTCLLGRASASVLPSAAVGRCAVVRAHAQVPAGGPAA